MATTTESYLLNIRLNLQNQKLLKELAANLQTTGTVAPKAAKAVQTAGKSFNAVGRNAQNAAFQVTDFIVQLEGGQSASRAFAQQAPQLLAGFGALGAVIGVAAASLPALIRLFKENDEELVKTAEDADAAAAANERLTKSFSDMTAAVNNLSLDTFIAQFQKAEAAQEQLLLGTLEFRTAIADLALGDALSEIQLPFDVGFESGQAARDAFIAQMDEFAKSIGIASGEMLILDKTFRTALDPETRSAENIGTLVTELQRLFVEGGARNTQLRELINLLLEAEKAARTLEGAQGELLRPIDIGAISERRKDPNQKLTGDEALKETASAAALAAIALNDYNQQQVEYEIGLEKWIATLEKTPEAFSAADEAAGIFENTMDSAFDGVARGTQTLSEAFESMTKSIIAQLLKLAAQVAITNAFGVNFLGGAFNPAAQAKGNAFNNGNVVPFARGGVVNSPTLFPMARGGVGLMGEAGSEAVVPLKRTAGGDLGVQSSPVNVTVNNNAPGVEVRTGRDNNGLTIDVVMETLAGSIQRGGNNVADALEQTYSVGRGRAVY